MNRDRMRTVVAIVVIAAMVLLAAGALGATLMGGSADRSSGSASAGAGDGAAAGGGNQSTPAGTFDLAGAAFVYTGPLLQGPLSSSPDDWTIGSSPPVQAPTVGDIRWFMATADGCEPVDRAAFAEWLEADAIVTVAATPGGEASIGDSSPLWVEGDLTVHDGCTSGDPLVPTTRVAEGTIVEDDPGPMLDFARPDGAAATGYAANHGVTPEQASEIIRWQAEVNQSLGGLAAGWGDRFVDARFLGPDETDSGRAELVVLLVDPTPDDADSVQHLDGAGTVRIEAA